MTQPSSRSEATRVIATPHLPARRRAVRRQRYIAGYSPERRRANRRRLGRALESQVPGLPADRSIDFMGVPFDLLEVDDVLAFLGRRSAADSFAYVVTPNIDHVARLDRTPSLIGCYRQALMSWCDSRPLRRVARLLGVKLPHLAGSDMTYLVFQRVLRHGDALLFITTDDDLLADLRATFPQYAIDGYSPPFGFETDPHELQKCAAFILARRARFIFIGVGCPRSEMLAHTVQQQPGATGTALCIGAALEFMTGRKQRAPQAFRSLGVEWVYRVANEPRRLWRRYLFAVPPFVRLLLVEVAQRMRGN